MNSLISQVWKTLLELVFPFTCHLCSQKTNYGVVLCSSCRSEIQKQMIGPVQIGDTQTDLPIFACAEYQGRVKEAIGKMKFRPSKKLADELAAIFHHTLTMGKHFQSYDVVIPVPLHIEREQKRGFNQSKILAQSVANSLNIPWSPVLQRIRATKAQATCDEIERKNNLQDAFALARNLKIDSFQDRRLLLIDDVATTGATLTACARTLQQLSPASIHALVIAHSYRRYPKNETVI